jgi:hypothetical protein
MEAVDRSDAPFATVPAMHTDVEYRFPRFYFAEVYSERGMMTKREGTEN